MPSGNTTIVDDPEESRFLVDGSDPLAGLAYDRDDEFLELIHTYVPPVHAGMGLGGLLVTFAVDYAAANDLSIIPSCPFAADWLRKHPDVASRAKIEWPSDD